MERAEIVSDIQEIDRKLVHLHQMRSAINATEVRLQDERCELQLELGVKNA